MSNVCVNRTLLYVSSEMVELSGKQDEWNLPCSDDENYGVEGKVSVNFCAFCVGSRKRLVLVIKQVKTDICML